MERFGLDKVTGRLGSEVEYGENVVDECSRERRLLMQKNTF